MLKVAKMETTWVKQKMRVRKGDTPELWKPD
jgi:hypothetical protein